MRLNLLATLSAAAVSLLPHAAAAETMTGYFEVEPGVALYYEMAGSGTPIVFVPGWTFTTEVFDAQMAYFSQDHWAITYDPRSHGRSTLVANGNDYITQGADLKALLDHLGVEQPILVGWSFGCLATWELIKTEGIDVAAAHICIDLPPEPMTADETDWTEGPVEALAGGYQLLRTVEGHQQLIIGYADHVMIEQEMSAELTDWIVRQSLTTPPWAAQQFWAAGMFSNYLETAQVIDAAMPSLFVVASHWSDVAVPYLEAHLPMSDVSVFGGHMMFWEYPDQFNEVVTTFLTEAAE